MIPFPEKILDNHIGILGKTGSGKTFASKVIAEYLLQKKSRVCIIDPTSAWWGLRSNAAGTGPGFPVIVFGGEHADVPITDHHGETLGEIIGTSNLPCVIDTQAMTVGERTRFFGAFAESLFRKNKGPLHLIIDESHVFMPETGRGIRDPEAAKMVHAGNNLVSLGRSRGLRIILISQRPAKLHKDSLTQCEGLIVMRLIAPQDRKAVAEWVSTTAAKTDRTSQVLDSLPELPTGEGWVWSPQINFLERIKFPMITTYDTSRAPDGVADKVVLAKVDLPTIQGKLSAIVEQQKANDPRLLKARIAELERAAKVIPVVDKDAVEKIRQQGYAAGYTAGAEDVCGKIRESIADALAKAEKKVPEKVTPPQKPNGVLVRAGIRRLSGIGESRVAESGTDDNAVRRKVAASVAANGDLTGPEQRIIDAIAWMESIGIDTPERTAVAFLAGYTIGGGAFANPCGSLRTRGMIEYASDGIRLTANGRSHANKPESPLDVEEIQKRVMERLPGPEQKILAILIAAYPKSLSAEECAARSGYAPTGGAFANPRGRLRTLGLIDYPERGMLRARGLLFLEGVR